MNSRIYFILFFIFCSCTSGFYDNERAEKNTISHAILASPAEIQAFKQLLLKTSFDDSLKTISYTYPIEKGYVVEIRAHGYYDSENTFGEIVLHYPENLDTLYTQIDYQCYSIPESQTACDIHNDTFYVAWISGNPELGIDCSINLRIINLSNKKTKGTISFFKKNWGIQRLTMAHHPASDMIFFAFNDYSYANADYLFFAGIDLQRKEKCFLPRQINMQDRSEKSDPHFCKDRGQLYLSHCSGDNWGMMSYTGKAGVGLTLILPDGKLGPYMIVGDSNRVNNEIQVRDDYLYYEHVTGTNYGTYEIKKIKLTDLYTN